MNRRIRAFAAAAVVVVAGLAAAPAVLAGDPCFHGYTIPPATTATTSLVEMEPCAFVPTNVRVATGSTVTFTNASGDVHILTGANQAWGDREREVAPGATVTATFTEPGVYAFSCALHRGMSGSVIVGDADQNAGAATASTSAPAGGGDSDLVVAISIAGLAVLAAAGWVTALLQRRRAVAAPTERVPAS